MSDYDPDLPQKSAGSFGEADPPNAQPLSPVSADAERVPPPPSPRTPPPPPGPPPLAYALPPRRPANVPLILGVVAAVLLVLGGAVYYFAKVDGRSITAGGTLRSTPGGLDYNNPAETISFTAPPSWSQYPTDTAQILVRGDGCSFGLLEQSTIASVEDLATIELRDLKSRHPDANPVATHRMVAQHNATTFTGDYTDAEGPMSQTYILIRRGQGNLVTLVESSAGSACAASFAGIEGSLRL